ncbi:WhiB family transcriptional regulator [Bifidobacterium samirii]|uniref:WhiB family transcriptional regulator n=1 Tax=Bifidobacterium samirii TaxID=2306974 RepID=UPI000F7EFDBA|nr:WhiB family transcriptional regulator [Bifidobacterium samirii]
MADWRDRASCRGMDPDMWFSTERSWRTRRAIRVCASCPVRVECRRFADEHARYGGYPLIGVWGGEWRG